MNSNLPDGCWAEFFAQRSAEPRPTLFLDRDGVVIVHEHHLKDPGRVALIEPTVEAIVWANRQHWLVGLVTNQSGIGQGYFAWEDFHAVQARMVALLAARSARLDFVCACPHHPAGQDRYRHPAHPWRKPNPGMIRYAVEELYLDLSRSVIVGDNESDINAGRGAPLRHCIRVEDGHYRLLPDGENHSHLVPILEKL
jgi:D-glycero-D-manno-heptose 1,7-bisphosphate phosphatase